MRRALFVTLATAGLTSCLQVIGFRDVEPGSGGASGTASIGTAFSASTASSNAATATVASSSSATASSSAAGSGGGGSTLLAGLVAYYKLDEMMGDRADSAAGNAMHTVMQPVTGAQGKIGGAAKFNDANDQGLSAASTPKNAVGIGDFTLALWINLTSSGNANWLVTKWSAAGTELKLRFDYNSKSIFFLAPTDCVGGDVAVKSPAGGIDFGNWHFVVAWRDAGSSHVQVDDGTVSNMPVSGKCSGTANLQLGNWSAGCANECAMGLLDEVGVWNRVLTPAERTALYNAGKGTTYPF